MIYRIAVPPDSVRSFKDPHHPRIRIVHALVNVTNLPLDLPLKPDPRRPKLESPVIKKITLSLRANDGRFHLLNRGICISAKSFDLDTRQNILKLDIPSDEEYGILDGGHTYEAIKTVVNHVQDAFEDGENGQTAFLLTQQFVHLEILVAIEEHLADIAEARNYSVALKPWTLAGYRDKFEWFLQCIGEDYRAHIRISENDANPVGILDLIQVMTAINPNIQNRQEAYNSSGKCLTYFTDEQDKYGYKKLRPVCRDIIRLYDHVRHGWIDAYNAEDETGKRGRFGSTKEATLRKRNRAALSSYYFLGDKVVTGKLPIEKGFALPLISGFRALLEERDGQFYWYADPFDFFDRHGNKLVKLIMSANDSVGNNPNLIGRDPQIYANMQSEVRRWWLEDRFADREVTPKQK